MGKVVGAADEAGAGGAVVVGGEGGIGVGGAFGGLEGRGVSRGWGRKVKEDGRVTDLDYHEAGTAAIGAFKVDVGLVVGDVEAADAGDALLDGSCAG